MSGNNSTSGFVKPNDRHTIAIVWQCLSTIFLCAVTVVHLDTPHRPTSTWFVFNRYLTWLFWVLLFPEALCLKAAADFERARTFRKQWTEVRRGENVSLKQAFYVIAGSLEIECYDDDDNKLEGLDMTELLDDMRFAKLTPQHTLQQIFDCINSHLPSDTQIDAESKADWVSKLIACTQSVWLVVQVIGRLAQHLDVALIEVVSAAFVVTALVAYAFWFHKPYNIPFARRCQAERLITPATSSTIFSEKFIRDPHTGTPEALPSNMVEPRLGFKTVLQYHLFLPLGILAPVISAIHCGAWNYSFPTTVEKWMWRISAVLLGSSPIMWIVQILLGVSLKPSDPDCEWGPCIWGPKIGKMLARCRSFDERLASFTRLRIPWFSSSLHMVTWTAACLYVCVFDCLYPVARLFILVEACISLRKAPVGIYSGINWASYWPHVS